MKDSDWEIIRELYHNPNMTKVANLLYMSQPALTRRLQHIESEFQATIVNRTPKGLTFTEEGIYLAKRAEEHLAFMQETREELRRFRENTGEIIIIGSSYTFSKYTLTDLLIPYKQKHPRVEFDIINDQSNLLFRRMLDGSIDVGFIRGDYDGAVNRTLIGKNQAYLVTRDPVNFEELPGMQFLGYKTNDRTLELLDGWWRNRYGKELPAAMPVGYIDVAWQLIHRGFGYTLCFLPDQFENEYGLQLTPLQYRDGTPVIRNTWFIYSRDKRTNDLHGEFIRYIEQTFAERNR